MYLPHECLPKVYNVVVNQQDAYEGRVTLGKQAVVWSPMPQLPFQ